MHISERFRRPYLDREIGRWVRAHTKDILDTPEALKFIVGDQLDPSIPRELKVSLIRVPNRITDSVIIQYVLLWSPVPPVTAITYFEPRFKNNPILIQYSHRVLEEHPVNITFFFVPQVVQALRNDQLGTTYPCTP